MKNDPQSYVSFNHLCFAYPNTRPVRSGSIGKFIERP